MPLEIISFKQLLSLPDTFEWLIEGIAPEIGTGFIAGQFGLGKSWLMQSLVLSIASGRKWLGKFPVKQGAVLMIDEENAQPLITKRMKELCEGMGISKKEIDALPIHYAIKQRMSFSLTKDNKPTRSYNELCEWSDKHKPVVVMSDSLTRVHSNNEDKSYEMKPVFENIDKYCQRFQTSALFAHHAGHNGDRMRGSVDIYGACDWSLFVKREGKASELKMLVSQDKSRWAKAIDPFSVKMKSIPGSFKILYDGKNDQELDNKSQSVIDALKHGPMDLEKLLIKSNVSQATYYRLINILEERELIVRVKNGRNVTISLKSDNNHFSPNGNGHKK